MTVPRRTVLEHVGTVGALSLAGCLESGGAELPGSLSIEWTSETATEYEGNHHAMTTATVDGQPVVGVPRNGLDDSEDCGVVAVDATGGVLWSDALPPEHCNAHAIGDVGVGDLDGDGRHEFLAATETRGAFALDAATGEEAFRQNLLDSIGYSAPVVADFAGDGTPELAVVDFVGNLSVVRADGSVAWTRELERPVYVTPIVADVTGDGAPNLVVNHGRRPSEVACFDGDGGIAWRTEQEDASRTWSLVEREAGPALAAATVGDDLLLLDGSDGARRWTAKMDTRVAVGGSDRHRVYAAARDGAVRALDVDDGGVRWTEQVTDEGVRMPAPAVGAVTGGESTNVVATAYDGTVAVLDGETGELLARRQLDADLYTKPVTADVTDDGTDEILVLYGDARVTALSYEERTD